MLMDDVSKLSSKGLHFVVPRFLHMEPCGHSGERDIVTMGVHRALCTRCAKSRQKTILWKFTVAVEQILVNIGGALARRARARHLF